MTNPAKKLSAYITVMPVAQTPAPAPQPQPQPQPSGSSDQPQTPDQPMGSDASDSTLGGCNAGGGSAGFLTMFLIGLAAFIRRRR
jgi:uncharacterized protein (TIGR03382 family)